MKPLLELHYLPSVGYLSAIARAGGVRLEACENYQKGSFRNRCRLASSQGAFELSLPLEGGKNNQCPIREVRLAYDENWPVQHWRTLETCYRSAPFWLFYADHFEPVFLEKKWELVWDFNLALFKKMVQLFDLQLVITFSEKFEPVSEADLRGIFSPKKSDLPPGFLPKKYPQLFEDRLGFLPNLSALDLLFCLGGKQGRAILLS